MSGFSTTPNFALKKPSTGADDGLWGTHWNQNADTLDATLKVHGDAIAGLGTGSVTSWNTRVGAVVLTNADVTAVLPPSSTTPTMDGTAAIGVGTTWARGDHIHPTDTSRYAATNPSGYQTAAQVAAAMRALNYADNSGFSINQRGYVSGTALGAGIYGHDRWKAGASGGTYTFAQSPGPATTITITAGTMQQVIEGASVAGGSYMLSWTGTAQGRVGAGSYAASPVAVAGVVAGANTTMEFNTGTLGQVKFEAGTVATPWFANSARYDLSNCQRFFRVASVQHNFYAAAGVAVGVTTLLSVTMRAAPTLTPNFTTQSNCAGGTAITVGNDVMIYSTATATGAVYFVCTFLASADL